MMASIQGIGFISPWGESYQDIATNYENKSSTLVDIASINRFDSLENIGAAKISPINDFNPKNYFTSKNMRKYNIQSRLGIACSKMALNSMPEAVQKDIDLTDAAAVYANLTHSTETANFLKSMVNDGPENASPRNFPLSTPNAMACHISTELGIMGPTINLCSRFSSGFSTIYNGVNMLRAGHAEHCLATSVDYQTQVILELYSRFGAYKKNDTDNGCYPTDLASSLVLASDATTDVGFGNIMAMTYQGSSTPNYRFPTDWETHAQVLQKTIGTNKIDTYLSSANGIENIDTLEEKSYQAVFKNAPLPEVISLKNYLGEAGTMPLFQVITACSQPAGHKSLISVVGTGGIHGALLIESTGTWEVHASNRQLKESGGINEPTSIAI